MTVIELVVGLENEPGRLSSVVESLARSGISIFTLTVAGTGHSGQARILTNDPRRARTVLMALDVPAHTEDAIVVVTSSDGIQMASVLDPLSREGVNVTHLQSFPAGNDSVVTALCTSNTVLTVGVLQEHGFELLDQDGLFDRFGGAE